MEIFQSKARFVVVGAGRRFGKSDLAAKRAICKALAPENVRGLPVWIVGPTQQQTRDIYWQHLMKLSAPVRKAFHVNDATVTLQNDVTIAVKGSDRPDSMLGMGLYDVTLDEFGSLKPQTWSQIIRPMLADVKGTALIIGTPPRVMNHFTILYKTALVCTDGTYEAFNFSTLDNPFIDPDEVEAARKTMPADEFEREIMASFEKARAEIFKRDYIRFRADPPTEKDMGAWIVAIDLAGFADVKEATTTRLKRLDQTVIAPVFIYDDGRRWVKHPIMGRWGVKDTAKYIVDTIRRVEPVRYGIEKGALYNAVVPYIQDECLRQGVGTLNFEHLSHGNKDKTARITWALQGRLEHGKYEFEPGDWEMELTNQFENFPSTFVHDDIPDALAYGEQLAEQLQQASFDDYDPNHVYWTPGDKLVGY